MFTIEQIKSAHAKVKTGADFPRYVQEIRKLGVIRYETFVADGHTIYFSRDQFFIRSEAKYPYMHIAEKSDEQGFKKELREHQQGKTDFLTFCKISADAGVEKWVVDIAKMICIYYDRQEREMLVETIPDVVSTQKE